MNYIMSDKTDNECVFCHAQHQKNDAEMLIVARANYNFVILNRYPYNNGHLMIVPYAHQPVLDALDAATRAELIELAAHAETVLENLYHPHGFNMGINIGKTAGAGVAGHIHFHIVPRWQGDANFMSTIGNTRVLPEDLEDTYQKLVKAWGSAD